MTADKASSEIHDNTFNGPTPTHTGVGDQHNHFAASPQRRRDVLAGLPPEPAGFVGRGEQIAELLELLDQGSAGGAVLVCAVGGLAGIGKSALAIHAARRAVEAGWFQGGVWLNLRGFDPQAAPVQVASAVPELLRALGWDGDLPSSPPEQVQLYHTVLAGLARQGRRVLLVLDNVADVEQVAGLLPRDQTHRAVVTSRMVLSSLGARMLDLDVLSTEDSVALLATALRDAHPQDLRADDEAALTGLDAVCGGLPLALQIAAALLKASPKRSVASLTGQLTDEKQRLERLKFPDSALRPGVRAALQLSYERLPESQQRILRQLSVDPGPDIATATLAALAGLSVAEAEDELYALEWARLIACDEHERWTMHDLVRLYARDLLESTPEEYTQARERLLDYYLATSRAANEHMIAVPRRLVSEMFAGRGDALAWFDANRGNLVGAVHLAAASEHLDIAMRLPTVLAEYFLWRRLFPEWIETQTASVAAARTLNVRHGEGTALNNLGIALAEVRRFQEAIDAHQRVASIFREMGDRRSEGMALNNLGLALRNVGRYPEAIDAHQQDLEICRETGDRDGEGMALNNLGLALWSVRRFPEAIDAHQQAADAFREEGDQDREDNALNNMRHVQNDMARSD
jgi:tetratricopeptide (TPR) repeat protein